MMSHITILFEDGKLSLSGSYVQILTKNLYV